MVKIIDHPDPLRAPARGKCKTVEDKRQPFKTSEWLIDLPDILEPGERDELAKLQAAYRKAELENQKYEPAQAHRYLDELRKRLDDPNIATDSHQAALANVESGRVGFREMRKSTARIMSRASVAALPLVLSVLKKAIPIIRERIQEIDDDFATHWCRVSGRDGCGQQSPLSAGLRRTLQDCGEAIDKYERVLEEQRRHVEGRGNEPYQHLAPARMLSSLTRWNLPEITEPEGGAQ